MDFKQLLEQAQRMKSQVAATMEKIEVDGESGGGLVRVRLNGRREAISLRIDPDALKGNDLDFLQDLIIAAFNHASRKIDETLMNQMGNMMGNFPVE